MNSACSACVPSAWPVAWDLLGAGGEDGAPQIRVARLFLRVALLVDLKGSQTRTLLFWVGAPKNGHMHIGLCFDFGTLMMVPRDPILFGKLIYVGSTQTIFLCCLVSLIWCIFRQVPKDEP